MWFSYIILLWVFVGTIWYSSLWSKRRVGSRPEASPQLSYSHKLGLKSWWMYFHILKSAFSYFIFWQTQFETSFWLSIFIGDIHFSEYTQGNLSFWIDNGGNLIGFLNFYQRQVAPPKRMNFQKNFKLPLTPTPPHFRKIMLQFFFQKTSQKPLI